jgi:two-component system, response regulator RegA
MSDPVQTILVVDDDATFVATLERALRRREFRVLTAHTAAQALAVTEGVHVQRAVLDLKLENESGLALIPPLVERFPEIRIVMLTGYSSIPTTVEAIKLGACNYLCKPANAQEILAAFEHTDADPGAPLPEQPPSLERLEWEHIQRVLTEHAGNISATARALGMHRRTLQRKLGKRPVRR